MGSRYFPNVPESEINVDETSSNMNMERNKTSNINEQADISFSANIERLEELTKIKAKERNDAERKEIRTLRMRIYRHENEQNKEKEAQSNRKRKQELRQDMEKKKTDNNKQKIRMRKIRTDEKIKQAENEKQRDRMREL